MATRTTHDKKLIVRCMLIENNYKINREILSIAMDYGLTLGTLNNIIREAKK